MKNNLRITRHVIKPEDNHPFIFIGIVTTEADYRLSVFINKLLGISFKHSGELTDDDNPENPGFSVFSTSPLTYSLISNKKSGNFLIRKLKNIDFFLVLHDKSKTEKPDVIAATLRKNPDITAVFIFNSQEIRDKNTFLLLQ